MASIKDILKRARNRAQNKDIKESIFFKPLRNFLVEKKQAEQQSYTWESIGHKLYPSSFPGINMCPKEHVEVTVHKDQYRNEDILFSMTKGSAIHSIYQTLASEFPGFLYDYFSLKDFSELYTEEQTKYYEEKFASSLPEVYIWIPESHTCGKIDFILNVDGEPVVLDLKTMSVEDTVFNKDKQVWETNLWEGKREKVAANHELQVNYYGYVCNKYNLLGQKVKRVGVVADNLLIKGSQGEQENTWEFTDLLFKQIEELDRALTKCRNEYLNKKEVVCDYKLCSTHGGIKL